MTFDFSLPLVTSVYQQVAAGDLDVCIQFLRNRLPTSST
jgi:hypothetical protein